MIESIKYISSKSKELLILQIEAFRSIDQKSGIIVGIASLFLPLFIASLTKQNKIIQIASIIPILLLLIGIVIILYAIRSQRLAEGFNEDEFDRLINRNIKHIFIAEISYNKYCIQKNNIIVDKKNRFFNIGLILIIVAIILSIILLSINVIISFTIGEKNA